MDDLLIVALLVLICSITVMFSQEFGRLFKKIFAIPGMKLILPLAVLTTLIVNYEDWVLWSLIKSQNFLLDLTILLANGMPFDTGAASIANILVLIALTLLPVFAFNVWYQRKNYHLFPYSYLVSTVIWLFVAVLLTLTYHY